MAPRARKLAQASLRLGLSVVALVVVLRQLDTEQLSKILRTARPGWLVAGLLLYTLSKVISSFRLTRYFRANAIHLGEAENLRLYWVGMFYNLFLPGGIGGDAYKVWVLHSDHKVSAAKAFQSVLFDRLSGLFMLGFLALLLMWVSFPEMPWRWALPAAALVAAIAFIGVHAILARDFIKVLPATSFYSLAVQLVQLACAWTLLQAVGIEQYTGAYLTVFLLSSAAAVLPISIGGIGIRELVFVTATNYAPLSQEAAVAFSLLFFLVTAACSLPGAFLRVPQATASGEQGSEDGT